MGGWKAGAVSEHILLWTFIIRYVPSWQACKLILLLFSLYFYMCIIHHNGFWVLQFHSRICSKNISVDKLFNFLLSSHLVGFNHWENGLIFSSHRFTSDIRDFSTNGSTSPLNLNNGRIYMAFVVTISQSNPTARIVEMPLLISNDKQKQSVHKAQAPTPFLLWIARSKL